jgi:tetrapyrrole methylase family protein/MazG family protein
MAEAYAGKTRFAFDDLLRIMQTLRAPGGCPWDREQDHVSLKRYLIEETYEVLEAIDLGRGALLCEELGDVLLQVVFHAEIADSFDMDDVISGICKKMIARHPHVFGGATARDASEVLTRWEEIKRSEKGVRDRATVLKTVPANLPALMRAYKVQQKASDAGFDWDALPPVLEMVREELREVGDALARDGVPVEGGAADGAGGAPALAASDVKTAEAGGSPAADAVAEELGDLFFAAVNLARFAGVHPELALTAATEKFIRRFEKMERLIVRGGGTLEGMSQAAMDEYWERVKRDDAGD